MKKRVPFFYLIAFTGLFLFAQNHLFSQKLKTEDIPDDITQTLYFEHPGAKVSAWNLENNIFVATFKEERSIGKIYISNDGKWIKTTYNIPKNELPPGITEYIKNNYPFYNISVSLLQETPEERMHYYIEAKPEGVGMQSSMLTFNDAGILINRIDPEGFEINKKEPEKTVDNKQGQKSTAKPGSKPAPKAVTKKTTEVSQTEAKQGAPAKKSETKPVAKQSTKTTKQKVEKEKPVKKEKVSKPVYDKFGNEAIPSSSVPGIVLKEFAKKVQIPEDLNWFKIDTFYVAKCIAKAKKTEVFITENGVWVKTYVEEPLTSVTGNMQKHLNSFYQGWKFKQAIKEFRSDKQDKTIVEIYEKENWKSKLHTTVIFDKTGKLIRSIDPDYSQESREQEEGDMDENLNKYYDKMDMGINQEEAGKIPAEIMNAFKAKYPRITNPQWSRDDDDNYLATYLGARGKEICVIGQSGTILQTLTMGNIETLSSNIKDYIKSNHKGFKAIEYYAVRDLLEKRNIYKVIIENKKTKEELTLLFTTSGKIIE